MDKIKEIFIRNLTTDEVRPLKISMSKTVKELKKEIEKLFNLDYSLDDYCIRVVNNGMHSGKRIQEENEDKTLFENHFFIHCVVIFGKGKNFGGGYSKEINIKFIKEPKNILPFNQKEEEIFGLLKLCLLKEISSKFTKEQIKQLPNLLSYIITVLKNGYIGDTIAEEDIKKVLEKMKGSDILNFSKYIDQTIDLSQIKMLKQFLNQEDKNNIDDIQNRLVSYNQYMKMFEKDFEIRKKNSIFEFSIISLVVKERENLDIFEKERKKCPNRVDKILYHGTAVEIIDPYINQVVRPIPWILTGHFKKSTVSCQHGEGVYFTDTLDYCWFYGGKDNRDNGNIIPNINDTFTMIACATYYDNNGFRKVKDWQYTPKKNEINFAYADSHFATIEGYPDKQSFMVLNM